MSIVLVLAGCNAAAKEKDEYFETTQKNIDANKEEIQSALDDFVGAVFDSEPEESIKILNEEMIPKYEKLLKTMNDVELKENELLIELNDLSKQAINRVRYGKASYSKRFVWRHYGQKETGETKDIDLEAILQEIYVSSEKQVETTDEFAEKLKEVAEEYGDAYVSEEEIPVELDLDEVYGSYEQIITQFIDSVGGLASLQRKRQMLINKSWLIKEIQKWFLKGKWRLTGSFSCKESLICRQGLSSKWIHLCM